MLITPVEKLKIINEKENLEIKKKDKNTNRFCSIIQNHLPYSNLSLKIAQRLPEAPIKPIFKIFISEE